MLSSELIKRQQRVFACICEKDFKNKTWPKGKRRSRLRPSSPNRETLLGGCSAKASASLFDFLLFHWEGLRDLSLIERFELSVLARERRTRSLQQKIDYTRDEAENVVSGSLQTERRGLPRPFASAEVPTCTNAAHQTLFLLLLLEPCLGRGDTQWFEEQQSIQQLTSMLTSRTLFSHRCLERANYRDSDQKTGTPCCGGECCFRSVFPLSRSFLVIQQPSRGGLYEFSRLAQKPTFSKPTVDERSAHLLSKRKRGSLNNEKSEAAEAFEVEHKAVLKLQTFVRRSAQLIARVFRGHLARSRAAALHKEVLEQRRLTRLSCAAAIIQKYFRGYLSRRRVFDFSSRTQFLRSLVKRQQKQQQKQQQEWYSVLCLRLVQMEEAQALAARFAAAAQSRHHLRSTREIPGVFQPPQKAADGGPSHKRRDTRLPQVASAAAAAAKQLAQERHLEAQKLLGVEIDCLLREPQKTVAALAPSAAARGPAAAVRELQQATQTLLRGCATSPSTRTAAATAAATTAAGRAG
ncbi:hypothetical protein Esti_003823 [Eimeria stiedai]